MAKLLACPLDLVLIYQLSKLVISFSFLDKFNVSLPVPITQPCVKVEARETFLQIHVASFLVL